MTFRLASLVLIVFSVVQIRCHPYHTRNNPDASESLLASNAQWAADVTKANPDFFINSAQGQNPQVMWIGCSDSRVPESVITSSAPGDIFVERNIGNQIPPNDANSNAVLEYAIGHLEVEHVVVVGHTSCGGATASLAAAQANSDPSLTIPDTPASDPLNLWLAPFTELALQLKPQYASKSQADALEFLVEQNVRAQVDNVANTEVIKEAWKNETEGLGRQVRVHGWVYDLSTGLLMDLNVSRGPAGYTGK